MKQHFESTYLAESFVNRMRAFGWPDARRILIQSLLVASGSGVIVAFFAAQSMNQQVIDLPRAIAAILFAFASGFVVRIIMAFLGRQVRIGSFGLTIHHSGWWQTIIPKESIFDISLDSFDMLTLLTIKYKKKHRECSVALAFSQIDDECITQIKELISDIRQ